MQKEVPNKAEPGWLSEKMEPCLSVSIVSYNTWEYLQACLQALYSDPWDFPFEVIVVDNGSGDGSPDRVEKMFPQVQLIRNDHNRYFSPANNQALQASSGRYILMLNSDIEASPQALSALVRFLDHTPSAGAVGCLIRHHGVEHGGYGGKGYWPQVSLRDIVEKLQPLKFFINWRQGYAPPPDPNAGTIEVETLMDAGLLVRRSALEKIGFYDERLLLYYTEDDLCIRLRQAGWKLFWLSGVEVFHHAGQSARQVSKAWITYLGLRDMFWFVRKYWGMGIAVGLGPLFALHFVTVQVIGWRNWLREIEKK